MTSIREKKFTEGILHSTFWDSFAVKINKNEVKEKNLGLWLK